jgi:hypothetical protein
MYLLRHQIIETTLEGRERLGAVILAVHHNKCSIFKTLSLFFPQESIIQSKVIPKFSQSLFQFTSKFSGPI